MNIERKALEYVMNFYDISEDVAVCWYSDEIAAAINLINKGIIQ